MVLHAQRAAGCGGGSSTPPLKVSQAGQSVSASSAEFVAGNRGSKKNFYPAAYGLDNLIAVAATDHDDDLAGFSSYGSS